MDELIAGARAASEAVPTDLPWIVFRVGSVLQAAYRFSGRADLRGEALRVCGLVADQLELPRLAVQARALMGNIHMLRGSLHRTVEHCDAALDLARATGLEADSSVAMAHQFRGYALFEWNRLPEAEEALGGAWDLAGEAGRGVRSGVARTLAELRAASGDGEGVETWLRRLEEVVSEPMTLRNREWLAAVRVRLSLGTGDLRAVESWLGAYDYRATAVESMAAPELLARLHELEQVLALLEATGRWDDILRIAPRVVAAARDERRWFAARAATAVAVAMEASNRPADADLHLDDALALGAEGGFVRAYTEGTDLRSGLLERAAVERGVREATRVLEASRSSCRPERNPLTPTQLDVLGRVAAGGSNKSIARDMGISVSTVKTHLRHVFARLEVSSRTQAVARARSDGLLGLRTPR